MNIFLINSEKGGEGDLLFLSKIRNSLFFFCTSLLEIGRKEPEDRAAELGRQGHVFQLGQVELPAFCQHAFAEGRHLRIEIHVKDFGVELEVETETAGIVVGRAYLAVVVVNAQEFCMGKGRRLEEDAHS